MSEREEGTPRPEDEAKVSGPKPPTEAPEEAAASADPPAQPEDDEQFEEELDPEVRALRARLEQSEAALQDAQARLRAVSKKYTELQDEMVAYRRRMELQAEGRLEQRVNTLIEKFFEPVQNLKRSLQSHTGDAESLREGLEMIQHQFAQALHKLGVEEVPGEGARFDPNLHDALMVQPVEDPEQDGLVLAVYATGYRVGDKLLQPAQVIIGKYGEGAAEA